MALPAEAEAARAAAAGRPLRILYVSQYFPPEMGAPSARVFELSREWVRLGHEVTVLTAFAHHPHGRLAPEDRGVWLRRERTEGIRVQRVRMHVAPNRGVARRMLSYASFMASALALGRPRVARPRPDVVIGTSPQLLCALAAALIARSLGVPFVFEVRDLWPESITAVGAFERRSVVAALRCVAAWLYGSSARIVTVSEGCRERIASLYDVPRARVSVIPNGVDAAFFDPAATGDREALRARLGWQGRFVVLYAGTHGMAHGLEAALRAASIVAAQTDVRFAFVGDGAEREALIEQAAQLKLTNVDFIGQQGKSEIRSLYAACDAGLVHLRAAPLFRDALPSKLFEYLAMERPVVLGVDGEARRLLDEARAGLYVPPEDAGEIARAVLSLRDDADARARAGRAGRSFVTDRYDRAALARRYADTVLQDVAARGDRR